MKRYVTLGLIPIALLSMAATGGGCGTTVEPIRAGEDGGGACTGALPSCTGCCGDSVAAECTDTGWSCPFLGCPAGICGGSDAGKDGSVGDSSDADTVGAGPLILKAIGGAGGEVGASATSDEPGVWPQQTCSTPVVAGACQLTSCQPAADGGPSASSGNFGAIFASVGTTTESLLYSATGYQTIWFPSTVALGGGDTMTFRGGNGTSVPTFAIAAVIPQPAVLMSPVATADGGTVVIDSSQDLSVTWLPISSGQVDFELGWGEVVDTGIPETFVISITCTFSGTAGSGVVSQTLLSALKEALAAPSQKAAYGSLSSKLTATTVVDELTIVTQSSLTLGTPSSFNATVQ